MRKDIRRNFITLGFIVILLGLGVWVIIPNHPHIAIGSLSRDLNIKYGLDLSGGTSLIYKANVDENNKEQSTDSLAGVRDVIERRINAFGVAEPIVQTNRVGNEYRIIVELAGVYDPQEAIKQIGETPQLDFREEKSAKDLAAEMHIDAKQVTGSSFVATNLSGKNLKRATVSFDQVVGQPQVSLEFDSEGSKLFADLTKKNIGKQIAIYLDGVPISAPTVQSEITNGQAVISGGFTLPEAKQLAQRLNAGALPVPIELIGQQVVGPVLGKSSIEKSIVAGVIGLLAVIVWMISFYRLPGVIASIAVVIYAILFLAIVKLIPITLTLSGIAGFILSIGMAVDANILIFERMRENLRLGKSVPYALQDGFKAAWSSINASNTTSLLSGFILYTFGTSIVRGFALTFVIGVLLSLFSAITITRTLLSLILEIKATHKPWLLAVKSVHQSL